MRSRDYTALPAPHGDVRVSARDFDYCVYLVYTGMPEALLAAGAVEPHMFLGARTCGKGQDAYGNHYRRKLSGRKGRVGVARYLRSLEGLQAFPGYREDWIPDPVRWVIANPGKLHISATDDQERVTGARETLLTEGLANTEDFDFDSTWQRSIRDSPGYTKSILWHRIGDYYIVDRTRLPPPVRERTLEERIESTQRFLTCIEDNVRRDCSAETQCRIGVHISAIMAELNREIRRSPTRSAHLRLVVDNTP